MLTLYHNRFDTLGQHNQLFTKPFQTLVQDLILSKAAVMPIYSILIQP